MLQLTSKTNYRENNCGHIKQKRILATNCRQRSTGRQIEVSETFMKSIKMYEDTHSFTALSYSKYARLLNPLDPLPELRISTRSEQERTLLISPTTSPRFNRGRQNPTRRVPLEVAINLV